MRNAVVSIRIVDDRTIAQAGGATALVGRTHNGALSPAPLNDTKPESQKIAHSLSDV